MTENYWNGSSNYNGLLRCKLNRRLLEVRAIRRRLHLVQDHGLRYNPACLSKRARPRNCSYGLSSSDQTHVLTINYSYSLPKLSSLVNNGFVREAFDGWQFSGISTFADGTPGSADFLAKRR